MESLMKRSGLILPIIVAAAILSGCGGDDDPVPGESSYFNPRRYEGTSLIVIAPENRWVNLVESNLFDFLTLTGIRVDLKVYPAEQYQTKTILELISGESNVDVYMIAQDSNLDMYTDEGWFESLDRFFGERALLWPDYHREQLTGEHYLIPIPNETGMTSADQAWNLAVSSASEQKEAAWVFLQWATRRDNQLEILSPEAEHAETSN